MKRTAPLRRSKPIRKVSTKRAAQLRDYAKLRQAYLAAHPICEVWLRENKWSQHPTNPEIWQQTTGTLKQSTKFSLIASGAPEATEIHHTNKRRGAMLNDQTHWLAVCRENHERIENNKAWARANGYLLNF